MSALRAAERYVGRGFAVVPIPHGKKGPNLEGWEGLRLSADELPQHFNSKPQNIGLLLGEPSGGLVDVDHDVPETTKIAGRFLSTTLTSGRESSPHSHWWYVAPGAKTVRYKDVDGQVLVELRSTGCQTIVEPSLHPSGERVVWHRRAAKSWLRSKLGSCHVGLGNSPPRHSSPGTYLQWGEGTTSPCP